MKTRSKHSSMQKRHRWNKGHSSDSNPKTRKFRDQVKSHFATSDLRAVGEDNENNIAGPNIDCASVQEDDDVSVFTSVSTCTLATFKSVHRRWKSGSSLQPDVLSVLGSVAELVRENGGSETEVDYFAALLATLDALMLAANPQSSTSAAALYLLYVVCKSKQISDSLLQNKFLNIVRILHRFVLLNDESGNTSAVRYTVSVLGRVLSVQDEPVWAVSPETLKTFSSVLQLVISDQPPSRKAAQKAVALILSRASLKGNELPSKPFTEFCVKVLETCGGSSALAQSSLYILNILNQCIFVLPAGVLKQICEVILRLLALSNHLVTTSCFHVLGNLFLHKPSEKILSAKMNAQLLLALHDFVPHATQVKPLTAWISAVTEANIALYYKDKDLFIAYSVKCIQEFLQFFIGADETLCVTIRDCIGRLVDYCVSDLPKEGGLTNNSFEQVAVKVLEVLNSGLSYQFIAKWPFVLNLISRFFTSLSVKSIKTEAAVRSCLASLGQLRESQTGADCKAHLDHALSLVITALGPETVLQEIPLGINPRAPIMPEDVPRSWMLPLLRKSIKNCRASYFFEYFFPLATALHEHIKHFHASGQTVNSRVYDVVEQQIWDLLPSFLKKPVDLTEALKKGLAKLIGTALVQRPDIRLTLLRALRTMVVENIDNEANLAVLKQYGGNYLPILFNIYTTDSKQSAQDFQTGGVPYDAKAVRLAVLETIRFVLKIPGVVVAEQYLSVALQKIQGTDQENMETRQAVLDLIISMTPYFDSSSLLEVYKVICTQYLGQSADRRLQKKALRVLEEICLGESEACKAFVSQNLGSLKCLLVNDFNNISSAAKASRVKCLEIIVKALPKAADEFITEVLPEFVLCLRESSRKTKRVAARTLISVAELLVSKQYCEDVDSAVKWMFARLSHLYDNSASVDDITCFGVAARLLVYQFRSTISPETLVILLQHILPLLRDQRRPVVKGCIEFLTTVVGCAPQVQIGLLLEVLIPTIFEQTPDNQRHFRFLTRKLLTKLAKKFGAELIQKWVPEEHHKQLTYIRKKIRRERATRERGSAKENEDESDNETLATHTTMNKTLKTLPETIADLLIDTSDEEGPSMDSNRRRKKPAAGSDGVWFRDDQEEEILDLMDNRSVSQRMSTVDPINRLSAASKRSGTKKDSNRGFKVADDGRLMIGGEQMDMDNEAGSDSEDSIAFAVGGSKNRSDNKRASKKGKDELSDDEDYVDEDRPPTSSYRPGGKGIHRPLLNQKPETSSKSKIDKKKKKSDSNVQPYEYLPLKFAALSKRKKAKFAGRFKHLVEGARKGAMKGKSSATKKVRFAE